MFPHCVLAAGRQNATKTFQEQPHRSPHLNQLRVCLEERLIFIAIVE